MPPTSLIHDCQRFAQSVTSAGGKVPDTLSHLLRGYEVLTAPAVTGDPASAILDAVADGSLTQAKLDKLLPPAATADKNNQYRQGLASRAERMLVQRFYRTLEKGGADEVLNSLRPKFDEHAAAIAEAKSVGINSESSLEHLVASADSSGLVKAWNDLDGHIQAITRITHVASQFGCRPSAMFPQVKEFTAGHVHLLDDRALMACDGGLLGDSSLFRRPDAGHRTSPFFRTALKLHTIAEAQARHNLWAADEHDRINLDRPRSGRILEGGEVEYDKPPRNPFREKVSQ